MGDDRGRRGEDDGVGDPLLGPADWPGTRRLLGQSQTGPQATGTCRVWECVGRRQLFRCCSAVRRRRRSRSSSSTSSSSCSPSSSSCSSDYQVSRRPQQCSGPACLAASGSGGRPRGKLGVFPAAGVGWVGSPGGGRRSLRGSIAWKVSGAEQGRAGQSRAEQVGAEQGRAQQSRSGQSRAGAVAPRLLVVVVVVVGGAAPAAARQVPLYPCPCVVARLSLTFKCDVRTLRCAGGGGGGGGQRRAGVGPVLDLSCPLLTKILAGVACGVAARGPFRGGPDSSLAALPGPGGTARVGSGQPGAAAGAVVSQW